MRPTPLSGEYEVEVRYSLGKLPSVQVVDPPLEPEDGWLPHIYTDTGALCLSLPHQWNQSMLLAKTTMPWVCKWLYYYEFWKATGEWFGGGELHGEPESLVQRRAAGWLSEGRSGTENSYLSTPSRRDRSNVK